MRTKVNIMLTIDHDNGSIVEDMHIVIGLTYLNLSAV